MKLIKIQSCPWASYLGKIIWPGKVNNVRILTVRSWFTTLENMYCDVAPNCPSIIIRDQETDDKHLNPSSSITFHIYHLIIRCTKHGRIPLTDKKSCCKCQQDTASGQSTKIYTRKELVMMEKTISNFHTSFYIPEIQKLAFHIPHVQILGTNHCGDSRRTAFKRRK